MNVNRLLTRVLVAGLAALGFGASAAPLSGAVSTVGALCLGLNPAQTQDAECSPQDVSTLTYLDFIGAPSGLNASPGNPGSLMFLTATGDLMPLVGAVGQINDFALPGPGDPMSAFSPVTPLWTATGTDGATYTYVLASLTGVDRSLPNALDVRGTGTICRNGTDCNLFSFIFTTQNAQGAPRTTFSASQSGFTNGKVPEPASLALLGLGLAGFAVGVRRRRR